MFVQPCDGEPEVSAKVTLSFVILLALAAPLAAKQQLQMAHRVVLTKASPGCAKREEFDTMIDFAQQRDAVGFAKYMASHNCPVLQAGTTAVYEDGAYSGRAMCIRPLGASDCFWIPSAAAQEISRF
jgi:hypothetical protein